MIKHSLILLTTVILAACNSPDMAANNATTPATVPQTPFVQIGKNRFQVKTQNNRAMAEVIAQQPQSPFTAQDVEAAAQQATGCTARFITGLDEKSGSDLVAFMEKGLRAKDLSKTDASYRPTVRLTC